MGSPGIKEESRCAVASAYGLRGLGSSMAARLPQAHQANVNPEGAGEVRASGRDRGELGSQSDAPSGRADGCYADKQPQGEET